MRRLLGAGLVAVIVSGCQQAPPTRMATQTVVVGSRTTKLVTEGDARNTVEMNDRYVIEPAFAWWDRTTFESASAKRVTDDFRYASDTNTHWLEPSALSKMLADVT